jgi:hypothetical protein
MKILRNCHSERQLEQVPTGWTLIGLLSIAFVTVFGMRAAGATVGIVSPSSAKTAEGDEFRQPASVPTRVQILIPASEFAELPSTHRRIVAWNYRSDASQPASADWSFGDAQVFMSTTDKTPETLTNVFDDNHGADKTLVQDGAISFPLVVTGLPDGPRDFAAGRRLGTPFCYDPAQGNLLLERVTLSGIPVSPRIDVQTITGPGARVLLSLGSATAATGTLANQPPVLQFEFAPRPGDYNEDGYVDAADYVVWRDGLGTTYTEADYDVWRAHFGTDSAGIGAGSGVARYSLGASAEPLSAAVPEPAAIILSILALLLCLLERRPTP